MRRCHKFIRIAAVLLLFFLFPLTVCAGGDYRDREHFVCISLYDAPAEAAYADILITRDSLSAGAELNSENAEGMAFDKKQLAEYSKDGFVSFSLYYEGVLTNTAIEAVDSRAGGGKIEFGPLADERNKDDPLLDRHLQDAFFTLRDTWLKIVLLDKDGNIIKVSEQFTIHEDSSQFFRTIEYHCSDNKAVVDYYNEGSGEKGLPQITGFVAAALIMVFLIIVFKLNRFKMKIDKQTSAASGNNNDNSERKEAAK